MRIGIISTYPAAGSQNIGDQLITDALVRLIQEQTPSAEIVIFWRAADWGSIANDVMRCEFIIFACLAIRHALFDKTYPYAQNVIESGIPYGVISCGTDLQVESVDLYRHGARKQTLNELRQLHDNAQFFTTRGLITQAFCKHHELDKAHFTGDIAFYDPRHQARRFAHVTPSQIKRIAISDPHHPESFSQGLIKLNGGLQKLFPHARCDVLLHGKNPSIESLCTENGISFIRIYEDRHGGLDLYDDYQLHAGFRVHAHVSALGRRIPSYLLEQDGRGADYGLTLERKISVPCFMSAPEHWRPSRLWKKRQPKSIHLSAVDQLLARINHDRDMQFSQFCGLENQLEHFCTLLKSTLLPALANPSRRNPT